MQTINMTPQKSNQLIDPFGRHISYVRLSVTDRCDFRCVYCMNEDMTFLNRREVLSLEEIALIGQAFVELGVTKIRLTGGEPLVRNGILGLAKNLGTLKAIGLEELLLTTNGSQLAKLASPLKEAGVSRVNISLDSLNANRFKRLTRTGDLAKVIAGIDAAIAANFSRIKINSVIMQGRNDDEILDLIKFVIARGLDISFIEEMPLGTITDHGRAETFCSSTEIKQIIEQHYLLTPSTQKTGGPSRYYNLQPTSSQVGFISPHSHNFCGDCNRVRVTVEGRLLLCLGNEHSADLKPLLRNNPGEVEPIKQAILEAITRKPERHYFDLRQAPQLVRFMNMTGG